MKSSLYIIAEAGVNHNGSFELAEKLIRTAALAGADAVKFQTFKADKLVRQGTPMADYQVKNTGEKQSQIEMLKKLELSEEAHVKLKQICDQLKIDFLSTPFDNESLDFLIHKIGMKLVKISSGEMTNAPFLLRIAQSNRPVILSTGMSTVKEIQTALSILAFGYLASKTPTTSNFQKAFDSAKGQTLLLKKVILLHCTSEYPVPFEEVNLKAMETLARKFGLAVGLSDHTLGISIPIAAAALGAVVIEKHFTLDKNLPGPDHRASLDPTELKEMIRSIRQVEQALGSPKKIPTPSELKNRTLARRSLVAASEIRQGEIFHESNLGVKRPADGISPLDYWKWLGKKAEKNYSKDEAIKP